ncbi:MAG: glycosyltransferase family 2 protein [Clostridiales bacterium]|nr:glycosyltransferase family 2 protein [Clostridiales bacterium]
MSVLIMMSTYNGSKYIETQLDSILVQDYANIEVLIRDDGSTDNTCLLLENYSRKYPQITWYSGENIGVQRSFFDLINHADLGKNYYAFSDQDDQWLPDKISKAVEKLEKISPNIPALYCSDKIIVDSDLKELKTNVSRKVKNPSFGNALVQNICTGCTSVINCALLQLLKNKTPDFSIMHDWWIYLVASCYGLVLYDNCAYIKYRQHEDNTFGAIISKQKLFVYRIKQFNKPRGEIYHQLKEFRRIYKPVGQYKELLESVLRSESSIWGRFEVVFNCKLYRQKCIDNCVLKLVVLLGKL